MNEVTLKLSVEETQVLVQLLDVAVRARGLEVAGAALSLFSKVKQATEVVENGI